MSSLTDSEKRPNSLFGPILLIAIGLFFLFNRLDLLRDLFWLDVLRLWPLLLIFLGLNILALQAPRPYASFLSGLIAVTAVLLFGFVLLQGLAGTPFNSRVAAADWQRESIQFGADGVKTAIYDIVIGPPGADLFALEDSRSLIDGSIAYQDMYLFDTRVVGSRATISLAPQNSGSQWVFLPDYWGEYGETDRWQLGLNRNVPADLTLVALAGRSQLDLRDLPLDALALTANAGDVELLLPGGDYDAQLITNAAATEIVLPADGRLAINLEVNAGAVTLHLPPGMALRVELDRAMGSFSTSGSRLQRVDGQENVWETVDYADAADRIDMTIHISLGSVTVD